MFSPPVSTGLPKNRFNPDVQVKSIYIIESNGKFASNTCRLCGFGATGGVQPENEVVWNSLPQQQHLMVRGDVISWNEYNLTLSIYIREGNSTNELWCTIPNNLQPNNIKNISMVLYVDSKKKNETKKRKGKHKDGTAVEGDTGDLKREKQNKKHKERIAVEGETRLCA